MSILLLPGTTSPPLVVQIQVDFLCSKAPFQYCWTQDLCLRNWPPFRGHLKGSRTGHFVKVSLWEAGRVQIRRKGLNARFLIRNKAQSPRILDQEAQFISH